MAFFFLVDLFSCYDDFIDSPARERIHCIVLGYG